MANKLLDAVKPANEFTTNSVVVTDEAIVINFTSDGVEKKKTLPFTEAGLKGRAKIKNIIEEMDYNIDNIRKDIKEGGNLYGLVTNRAEKQKAIDNAFAELRAEVGLANPIDAI